MNPVCVQCQIELKVWRNGTVAVPMADFGPVEIRRADTWRCPACGLEVLIGFSECPELRHIDPAFDARLDSYDLDPRNRVVRYWQNFQAKRRVKDLMDADATNAVLAKALEVVRPIVDRETAGEVVGNDVLDCTLRKD